LGKFNSRKIERSGEIISKDSMYKGGGIEICPESEEMAELVPMSYRRKQASALQWRQKL